MSVEWQNGFCDCCGSTPDCLLGCCVPCIHAYIANKASGRDTVMGVLQCFFYPWLVPLLRYQVREQKGIQGNGCTDILAGLCLPCCTTIQVKREFD